MPIPFDDTKSLRNALSVVRADVDDLNKNITILKANNPTNLSIPTINSQTQTNKTVSESNNTTLNTLTGSTILAMSDQIIYNASVITDLSTNLNDKIVDANALISINTSAVQTVSQSTSINFAAINNTLGSQYIDITALNVSFGLVDKRVDVLDASFLDISGRLGIIDTSFSLLATGSYVDSSFVKKITVDGGPINLGFEAGLLDQSDNTIAIGTNAGGNFQHPYSIAIGDNAGGSYQNQYSVAIGTMAGQTDQCFNSVAIGYKAGFVSQDTSCIAIGSGSGQLRQKKYALSIGDSAGQTDQGEYAIALGDDAGNDQQGNYAIAIGHKSGYTGQNRWTVSIGAFTGETNQGLNSIAIGDYAGNDNQKELSIAIGSAAGYQNQGVNSIAIGNDAGGMDQSMNCIAIGASSGSLYQKKRSIAIGVKSGYSNQEEYAIAIGYEAGETDQSNNSVAIGNQAGNSNQGKYSISLGTNAAYQNQGSHSVAIGNECGNDQQGNYSIAIGNNSGNDKQGAYSVSIGNDAGKTSQGVNSVAIGDNAGFQNQKEISVAVGIAAGYKNQNYSCVAIGEHAGQMDQCMNSVSIGASSGTLYQKKCAVAIGAKSGSINQGEYAIALGYKAGQDDQSANSIVFNAQTDTALNTNTSGLFIAPIRNVNNLTNSLYYDTTTKEVVYSDQNLSRFLFLTNGSAFNANSVPNVNGNNISPGQGAVFTIFHWSSSLVTVYNAIPISHLQSYDVNFNPDTYLVNGQKIYFPEVGVYQVSTNLSFIAGAPRITVGTNIRHTTVGSSTSSKVIGITTMDNYARIAQGQNETTSSMTKNVYITNAGLDGDYIEIVCTQMGNSGTAWIQTGWGELYINKVASTTIVPIVPQVDPISLITAQDIWSEPWRVNTDAPSVISWYSDGRIQLTQSSYASTMVSISNPTQVWADDSNFYSNTSFTGSAFAMCRMNSYVYFGFSTPPSTSPHQFDEVFLASFWCSAVFVNAWEGDYRSSNFEYNGDNFPESTEGNYRLINDWTETDAANDVFALWYRGTTVTYYSIRGGVLNTERTITVSQDQTVQLDTAWLRSARLDHLYFAENNPYPHIFT